MKKWIKGFGWVLVLATLTAVIILVLQNPTPVLLNIFVWKYSIPLFLLALASFIAGLLVAVGLLLPGRIRLAWRVRSLLREPRPGDLTDRKPHFKPIVSDSGNEQMTNRRDWR
ncbi:MAG: lipopolysaccharide assembly protein LapA domain-containing protein [Gammaproteobacteria bacterium]